MLLVGGDLARTVAERSTTNPDFGLLVEAYQQNSDLLDALAEARKRLGLSQRAVAARMGTSQAAIDRLEAAEVDPKLSTVQRLAVALGGKIEWHFTAGAIAQAPVAAGQPAALGAGWQLHAPCVYVERLSARNTTIGLDWQSPTVGTPSFYADTMAMSAQQTRGEANGNSVTTTPKAAVTPREPQLGGKAA